MKNNREREILAAQRCMKALKDKDKNCSVRIVAAGALGQIGPVTPSVVPALIKALRDEDWLVNLAATKALERINPFFSNCLILFSNKHLNNLLSLVTLGGKAHPGSNPDGHCFNPTVSPRQLARQIKSEMTKSGELQISVGFDTGEGIDRHRARFIALAFFIISQDLNKFRALKVKPKRDPGASYGLIIRGINVQSLNPLNKTSHRIDYLFQVSKDLSQLNLTYLVSFLQCLNLGLLLTVNYRGFYRSFRGDPHFTPSPSHLSIIRTYEEFEKELVMILRKYDSLVDPEAIYQIPNREKENQARKEALQNYFLEESLYPDKEWLVDLGKEDHSWPKLLSYLRAIEALLLHREANENEEPLGDRFLKEVSHLVFDKATDIEAFLEDKKPLFADPLPPEKDPFVDYLNFPSQTQKYLDTAQNLKPKQEAI